MWGYRGKGEIDPLVVFFSEPTGLESSENVGIGKAAAIATRGSADAINELAEEGRQASEVGVLQRPTSQGAAGMRGTDEAVREGEPATGIIVSREFLYFHGDRLFNV